ncbi:MAG TPA: winged helix DNA-binding protein [Allosphingosinicella sp.]|nr:winged helix DNA-binding protein [Allosphingosinicella sp.]
MAAAEGSDVNKAKATARLQQLSEEVGRIAAVLAALSEHEAAAAALAAVGGAADPADGERLEAGFIRSMIRARRLRDHFFRGEIFADPAWDMLLDLMAARVEMQRVAVSSLCIAAAVPPTTALRWIKTLCDQGLFVRIADPEDGRRVFIELSAETATMMEAYLKAVRRMGHVVI